MIERYTRPAMGRIWTLENRYRAWLAVEVAVCEAWAELGRVPAEAVKTIREKADIDVDRILEIEQTTRHDVIAFLTSLEEKVGPDARYIHLGCTSSDIVDTANGYLFMQAGKLIVEDIEKVLASLEALARKHKGVLCMGRTHGIHAEPTSFGLKMTGFHAEFQRHLERVKAGIESVRVGKISGAVGTYAFLSPELEEKALTRLGLAVDPHSTQIVQRDRYAHFFTSLAILAGGIERLCVELRHLQRTEVLEVEEGFAKGQKGSSAMPHKKNPILSERICGLARIVRGQMVPVMEGIPLWHEREHGRPCPPDPQQCRGFHGEPGPVARARHQPFVRGARHHARLHHPGRLRAQPPVPPAGRPGGQARAHEGEHGAFLRPVLLPARAHRPHRHRPAAPEGL